MKVKTFLASLLYVLSIQVKTSLESDVDASSSAKFGELPVLEDQDIFTKTSSVNVDANNYGKVLVNLLLEWLAWIAHMVVLQLFFK